MHLGFPLPGVLLVLMGLHIRPVDEVYNHIGRAVWIVVELTSRVTIYYE